MTKKVGLIIGGNRGIGKALVDVLATHWGDSGIVYLTGRSHKAAHTAKSELTERTGCEIRALVFDLSDEEAPKKVSQALMKEHGGYDLVVQNGAYLPRPGHPAIDDARPMIAANSHGTLRVLDAFLPGLRNDGQILIVASALGVLENLPEHLRARFNTKTQTPEEINRAIDEYVNSVEAGTSKEEGWPEWVNIASKVAQVAVTRSFARVSRFSGRISRGVRINAACPGVTLTDATRDFMGTVFNESEAQTPEEAALGLLGLLTSRSEEQMPYGELVQHGKVIPFGDESF